MSDPGAAMSGNVGHNVNPDAVDFFTRRRPMKSDHLAIIETDHSGKDLFPPAVLISSTMSAASVAPMNEPLLEATGPKPSATRRSLRILFGLVIFNLMATVATAMTLLMRNAVPAEGSVIVAPLIEGASISFSDVSDSQFYDPILIDATSNAAVIFEPSWDNNDGIATSAFKPREYGPVLGDGWVPWKEATITTLWVHRIVEYLEQVDANGPPANVLDEVARILSLEFVRVSGSTVTFSTESVRRAFSADVGAQTGDKISVQRARVLDSALVVLQYVVHLAQELETRVTLLEQ